MYNKIDQERTFDKKVKTLSSATLQLNQTKQKFNFED